MIYASLPTIQRWHNGWVVPNYMALGCMTGALLLGLLIRAFGVATDAATLATSILIPVAALLKLRYWRFIDRSRATSTPASATGLGAGGTVRLLEAPHTEENYLMREMGYRIARKHAAKLRRIALAAGFAAPLALTLLTLLVGRWGGALLGLLAVLSAALGVLVERWLFFAEARHVVTLYYGADRA
jgi:DMSO reductase anchor subunit